MKSEQAAEFYDNIFRTSEKYRLPPEEMLYYPMWCDVVARIGKGGAVIDLGCGPGQFGEVCITNNITYVGIDFSSEAIEMARINLGKHPFNDSWIFLHQNAFNLNDVKPTLTNSCGTLWTITLLEICEHLTDDIGLIKEIPLHSPVYISVPNFDSESHVRFFPTMREVIDRYSKVIDITHSKEYPISKVNKIFLIGGKRK